jgi:putative sigma-54 modulation protein
MPSSQALRDYAESKILKTLSRMPDQPIKARIVFAMDGGNHLSRCDIQTQMGNSLHVNQRSSNIYESVDLMIDKLGAQLRKLKKEKTMQRTDKLNKRWNSVSQEEEKTIN